MIKLQNLLTEEAKKCLCARSAVYTPAFLKREYGGEYTVLCDKKKNLFGGDVHDMLRKLPYVTQLTQAKLKKLFTIAKKTGKLVKFDMNYAGIRYL